jgi:hypothetical protein
MKRVGPKKLVKMFIKSDANYRNFQMDVHVAGKTLKKAVDMAKSGKFGAKYVRRIEAKLASLKK